MRYSLVLLLFVSAPCWSQIQPTTTGKADTKGPCSPAVTGNNNQFTITCEGIQDEKLRSQLLDLLNRLAKNRADAEAMMTKLDGCLQGVKEVREQQLPWHLTDNQKTELKRLLGGIKAKVEVHVIPSDRNASLLGIDLITVLNDSGWEVVGGGLNSDFTLNPQLVGVVLVVNHPDFPEAARLQSALNTVMGFQVLAELDDAKKRVNQNDVIFIAVGAKPPAVH